MMDSVSLPQEPLSPEDKATARAVRARKRKWRRRLAWGGGILAFLAAIAVVIVLAGITGGGFISRPSNNTPYSDSLTTNAAGWPQTNGCGERDGAYHIAPINTQAGESCFAPTGRYGGLDESVTTEQFEGSIHGYFGLVFRAVDGGDEYVFNVSSSGTAFVTKIAGGEVAPPSAVWSYTPGGAGPTITLRVVAQGSKFTCYVNGTQVGMLTDGSYTNGAVGLFVGSGGLDIAFTNFSIGAA
jgi:hypothetical protein